MRREDAGVYTARITNPQGEAVCSASLEVQGQIASRDVTLRFQFQYASSFKKLQAYTCHNLWVAESDEEKSLDGSRQPWFILEVQNQWCELTQRATFEAQATGKPTPTFRW